MLQALQKSVSCSPLTTMHKVTSHFPSDPFSEVKGVISIGVQRFLLLKVSFINKSKTVFLQTIQATHEACHPTALGSPYRSFGKVHSPCFGCWSKSRHRDKCADLGILPQYSTLHLARLHGRGIPPKEWIGSFETLLRMLHVTIFCGWLRFSMIP